MAKSTADKNGDQACVQCHSQIGEQLETHTHHKLDSSGSRCYNCHMPYSSYALFTAIRSHRVDSPSVQTNISSGRPNACNQCHVDQTLAWTATYLERWYGIPQVDLSDEQQHVAASLLWLLKGDAIQRVLAAWTLGWQPARDAAGEGWQTPLLAQLLDDPYSMVRYVANQSLKKLQVEVPGFDYVVAPEDRESFAAGVVDSWHKQPKIPAAYEHWSDAIRPFFDSDQRLYRPMLDKLFGERDDRPITLYE